MNIRNFPFISILTVLITGCAGIFVAGDSAPRNPPPNLDSIPDAVPKVEPVTTKGNPSSYVVFGKRYYTIKDTNGYTERGIASWYGTKFHGRKTSNGEEYDMYAMSAAHKTLPIPSYVEVRNLRNNRKVIVRVNDRGPFAHNRIIDLSYAAAHKLDILGKGTALVEIRVIDPRKPATIMAQQSQETGSETDVHEANLYLQVGAFSKRDNAEDLRKYLASSLTSSVQINEINNKPKSLYRVQVGPIDTVEEIDRLSEQLASLGIKTPKVIID